jgi:hypothetical protein
MPLAADAAVGLDLEEEGSLQRRLLVRQPVRREDVQRVDLPLVWREAAVFLAVADLTRNKKRYVIF